MRNYTEKEFEKEFPYGTIITISFDVRRCICMVGDNHQILNDTVYKINSIFGIDASDVLHFSYSFGALGNTIRKATEGERRYLLDIVANEKPSTIENIKRVDKLMKSISDNIDTLDKEVHEIDEKIKVLEDEKEAKMSLLEDYNEKYDHLENELNELKYQ